MSFNQFLLGAILSFVVAVIMTANLPSQKKRPMAFGDIVLFVAIWAIAGVFAVLSLVFWIAPNL